MWTFQFLSYNDHKYTETLTIINFRLIWVCKRVARHRQLFPRGDQAFFKVFQSFETGCIFNPCFLMFVNMSRKNLQMNNTIYRPIYRKRRDRASNSVSFSIKFDNGTRFDYIVLVFYSSLSS